MHAPLWIGSDIISLASGQLTPVKNFIVFKITHQISIPTYNALVRNRKLRFKEAVSSS